MSRRRRATALEAARWPGGSRCHRSVRIAPRRRTLAGEQRSCHRPHRVR